MILKLIFSWGPMDGRCRGEHLLKPLCMGKWSVRHVKYFVPPENVFIMKPLWDFCPFCMENFLANMSRGSYPIGDASFLMTCNDLFSGDRRSLPSSTHSVGNSPHSRNPTRTRDEDSRLRLLFTATRQRRVPEE